MNFGLSEHQKQVADRALDEEERHRRHLVVSLSGAHAYGFPSPDSDLDLKAIHIERTENLLTLNPVHPPTERLEIIDGVEIDYSSNELRDVLLGVLRGNGNFIERILSRFALRTAPALAELAPLVQRSISRRIHRHYQGFARGQLGEWEKGGGRSAKKLLYVLRTALTGTHALLTGEIETDLNRHLDRYGFAAARELIEQKTRGELAELPEPLTEQWRGEVHRLFAGLDDAFLRSPLPEAAANEKELEEWLLQLRRQDW